MAGSHRAPHRRRSPAVPPWAIMVAIVLALVPAIALTARHLFADSSSPSHASTDLPIPPVTPSTAAPSASPGSTPSGTPPAPPPKTRAKHLPKVTADAPRRITSAGAIDSGFDSSVTGLDASSDAEVARWDPRGSPGSPGTDTVYVIGRVRTGAAFADLTRLRPGAKVAIRTDSGTMTYTVSASTLQRTTGLEHDALFTVHKAGRLVLLGIRYDAAGHRLDKALVVTAQLSGATRS